MYLCCLSIYLSSGPGGFTIRSIITLACVEFNLYSLMASLLIIFTVHLFVHIGSFLLLRRYVSYILALLYDVVVRFHRLTA
jgi:hypothetical protein